VNLSLFQKPSRYINKEINAIYKDAPVKVALAFPDIYEIGMSHLGLKILYKIINDLPFASAERVFSPWLDLEAEMKAKRIPLSSLESNRPLKDFDIVGFSLQYELSYTTVLNMLYLGGIPLKSEERNTSPFTNYYPLVIAGGPCTVNPFLMSPFIDTFLIGDGEEAIKEILDTFYQWKISGYGQKESLLLAISEIEGMYVPSVQSSKPSTRAQAKGFKVQSSESHPSSFIPHPSSMVKRRFIKSLDDVPYPDNPIVPYASIIHDRVNIEVSRGCSMGCRFCQAGMIYRPVRERSPEKALELAEKSLKNTGYEEVAFTSLSAGDYSCLLKVVRKFNKRFGNKKIALSLPSLRVASVSHELLREIRAVRKTGFTIAPEAGTDRLRRVINKDFTEEDYEKALRTLFEEGWHNLKLYFMIGHPTETEEDIESIPKMAMKALKIAKQYTKRFVNINIGISPFVPKPHTPFQWYGQSSSAELKRKKHYIKDVLTKKGLKIKGHDVEMSLLEAAFARGDERLAPLIERAWSLGCRLDAWSEAFDFKKWETAMNLTGIDVTDFAKKTFENSDFLPWEKIDIGITKEFLWKEYQKALSGNITTDCRKVCNDCGLGCKTVISSQQSAVSSQQQKLKELTTIDYRQNKRFKPVRIRGEFSKTGRLRYLSHLELINVIHRAIRRAGFPLEYSMGFHPFPKISFCPPLGVGIAGLSEYFDMEIIPPFDLVINKKKINNILPEGICVKDMSVVSAKAESLCSFITRYEYEIRGGDSFNVYRFLSEKEINFKRGQYFINLRDMVEEARQIDEDTTKIIVVDQGDTKVRLGELLPEIFNAPLESLDITRVALYGWDGSWVRPLNCKMQIIDCRL
jgi:radical SAM family uncharacterized protein/radical SAM-linked protein